MASELCTRSFMELSSNNCWYLLLALGLVICTYMCILHSSRHVAHRFEIYNTEGLSLYALWFAGFHQKIVRACYVHARMGGSLLSYLQRIVKVQLWQKFKNSQGKGGISNFSVFISLQNKFHLLLTVCSFRFSVHVYVLSSESKIKFLSNYLILTSHSSDNRLR